MTDILATRRTRPPGPVYGRSTFPIRVLRSIAYDVRLLPLGIQTMADAITGDRQAAARRLDRQATEEHEPRVGFQRVGVGEWFRFGVVSSVLGVVSWFLVGLLGMAVVRGAFYGVVEDGPVGAGTWGGPTLAGA